MYLIHPVQFSRVKKKDVSSLVEETHNLLDEAIDKEEAVEMIYFCNVQESCVYSMSPWPDSWPPALPVFAEHPKEIRPICSQPAVTRLSSTSMTAFDDEKEVQRWEILCVLYTGTTTMDLNVNNFHKPRRNSVVGCFV